MHVAKHAAPCPDAQPENKHITPTIWLHMEQRHTAIGCTKRNELTSDSSPPPQPTSKMRSPASGAACRGSSLGAGAVQAACWLSSSCVLHMQSTPCKSAVQSAAAGACRNCDSYASFAEGAGGALEAAADGVAGEARAQRVHGMQRRHGALGVPPAGTHQAVGSHLCCLSCTSTANHRDLNSSGWGVHVYVAAALLLACT